MLLVDHSLSARPVIVHDFSTRRGLSVVLPIWFDSNDPIDLIGLGEDQDGQPQLSHGEQWWCLQCLLSFIDSCSWQDAPLSLSIPLTSMCFCLDF